MLVKGLPFLFINRHYMLPCKSIALINIGGKTPHEAWSGKKPSFKHLGV